MRKQIVIGKPIEEDETSENKIKIAFDENEEHKEEGMITIPLDPIPEGKSYKKHQINFLCLNYSKSDILYQINGFKGYLN